MSALSPSVIDFDYVGDSSPFDHLIKNINQTKDVIQFNMNLRRYKNSTTY